MRKAIFTLCAFSLMVVAAFGQTNKLDKDYLQGLNDLKLMNKEAKPVFKAGAEDIDVEGWYGWWGDWNTFQGGFDASASFTTLFPDSNMTFLYYDDQNNDVISRTNTWCAYGQGFDPHDIAWSDPDLYGVRDWYPYTIDSGFVSYGYFRDNLDTSIVDTLIVQIFVSGGDQLVSGYYSGTERSVFATPKQDRRRGLNASGEAVGASPTYEIKIPLTINDSTELNAKGNFFAKRKYWGWNDGAGLAMNANQIAHTIISFKPGTPYTLGDTLYYDADLANIGITAPVKTYNRFGVLVHVQTPNVSALTSYNNPSYIARWNRYKDPDGTPGFMAGTFNPGRYARGGNSASGYPRIAYKARSTITSIDEIDANGNGIGDIYPNPTANNAQFALTLGATEQTSVQVLDLTGKVVLIAFEGQLAQGEHTIDLNTKSLDAGMYIVKVTAGEFVQSTQLSITK